MTKDYFATGSAQWTIWRDSDCVDETGVPDVVGLQAAVWQVPYFNNLVPTGWNDWWICGGGGESDAWNPAVVALILLLKKSQGKIE